MLNLEWSPDAVDDLDLIWDIIAQDDVDAADVFIDRLREEARAFADTNPHSGNAKMTKS